MNFNEIIFSPHKFSEKHSAWIEHSPFAFFLIEKLQPGVFVELGTYYGISYFAFCQAIDALKIQAKAYAVDLFTGDEHAGYYGDEVFEFVDKINDDHFSHFSNIIKSSFDEANQLFEDKSIDLLHIDGLHTYEAVKHDYELWLPKMSEKGVIIFHDTAVKERGFGVWKLMDELKPKYPYFEFSHGYGLGILCTGKKVNPGFLEFVKMAGSDGFTQKLFENIGRKTWLEQQHNQQNLTIANITQIIELRDTEINNLQKALKEKENELHDVNVAAEVHVHENEQLKLLITQITTSPSWKLTAPFRYVKNMLKSDYLHLSPKIKLIEKSGLFDKDYYLQNYKDVRESGINPARHYLLHGGFEGRMPSPDFDSAFYLEQNSDVSAAGMNPLLHYINFGKSEGRKAKTTQEDKYKMWLKTENPDPKIFDKQRNFSVNLKNPDQITIFITSRGNHELLKTTMNSLSGQIYTHWKCFILPSQSSSHKINENDLKNLLISYPQDKFPGIANGENLLSCFENPEGFIGFLDEGETLRPACLWEFIMGKDEKAELIYSDHDEISEENEYCNPWFTPNWSPDLLISQNYIGGFYLSSTSLFLSLFVKHDFEKDLILKIDASLAWRYGNLLRLGSKTSAICHIPKVLWSSPVSSGEKLRQVYNDEYQEIQTFLLSQGTNADLEKIKGGKIRHAKWEFEGNPLVSIIIPTTGKKKLLKLCLDSLLGNTDYKAFEIILLDNGRNKHRDGIRYAKKPGLKVIEVNEPFNWAKINNTGAKYANGELLLFLNDDIEIIEPTWLTEMVRQALRKDVGVVGSLLLYPDGTLQHAGVFLVDHGGGARHLLYKQMPGDNIYQNLDECVREVSANTGACMMIKRTTFFEIGGFDVNFPLVGNDIDFCLKCEAAGYRNIWTPFSKLIHHESVSRKTLPIKKDEKLMWDKWGAHFLKGDKYYNPNLSLVKEDCSLKMNHSRTDR